MSAAIAAAPLISSWHLRVLLRPTYGGKDSKRQLGQTTQSIGGHDVTDKSETRQEKGKRSARTGISVIVHFRRLVNHQLVIV
jgi:hypothetical protein